MFSSSVSYRWIVAIGISWVFTIFVPLRVWSQNAEPFLWALDGQTMAVAWLDLANVPLEELEKLAAYQELPIRRVDWQEAQKPLGDLRAASVTRVVAVADTTLITAQPPLFLLETRTPDRAQRVLETLLRSDPWIKMEQRDGMLLVGNDEQLKRLQRTDRRPPNPVLLSAIKEIKSNHGVAVANSDMARTLYGAMLGARSRNPNPSQDALVRLLAGLQEGKLEWTRNGEKLSLRAAFADQETAEFFSGLCDGAIDPKAAVPVPVSTAAFSSATQLLANRDQCGFPTSPYRESREGRPRTGPGRVLPLEGRSSPVLAFTYSAAKHARDALCPRCQRCERRCASRLKL